MRVMILGAGGLLGRACAQAFAVRDEVAQLTRGQLDVCDAMALHAAMAAHKPDWVINTAAATDVDGCEKQLERAFAVNAAAPGTLALLCEQWGARLLHVSTDYVFDGEKGAPYHEWDRPNPINAYGRSKYWGEVAALRHGRPLVVRTQWLYGQERPGFVGRVLAAAERGEPIYGVEDRIGCPTYAPDLAALLVKLVHLDAQGVFHAANSGAASWYALACDALRLAGLPAKVQPVTTDFFKDAAPRPRCSVLQGLRMSSCGIAPLRPYKEALAAFIGDYVKSMIVRE